MSLHNQIDDLLENSRVLLSNIKPSEWCEKNRTMTSVESRFEGKFSYDLTPYTREIVDCMATDHPARVVSVMKGSGVGFSAGVIEPAVGWIISESPCAMLHLTGHADLSEEAVQKIDLMIDSCGIRHLIKPTVQRARNMKTGDTSMKKEFTGGSYTAGSANNHKLLRQRHVRVIFVDDFDAAKNQSKESGSTRVMIEQRLSSNEDKMKLFYISTPELKHTSNIEPVYLMGDQRRFNWECPCCGDRIFLEWSINVDGDEKNKAGMTWKVDKMNRLIEDSVGYICQSCGNFFDDRFKYELNKDGIWIPTAEPDQPGYYSYHLSALYAPHGMFGWPRYVRNFLKANPIGGRQNEALQKTHMNLCLGLPFEPIGESVTANDVQKNIRNYPIDIIPEKLSIADGNGPIVMITCACDLNGKLEDARLDYEIVAWSESGSSYSVTHGSIGTFIPNESNKKNKEEREKYTYEHHRPNNVWRDFDKVVGSLYPTDTGKQMRVFFTGMDTGHCELEAFEYIDKSNFNMIGLKGDKEHKFVQMGIEVPNFSVGKSRSNLYMLRVGQLKDDLRKLIKLRWDNGNDPRQPSGFMNYPLPSGGKYLLTNFFSHYESEHRILKDDKYIWEKKSANLQNHFWDVRIYNMAVKDIVAAGVCKENGLKTYSWKDFCDIALGRFKP